MTDIDLLIKDKPIQTQKNTSAVKMEEETEEKVK